MKTVYALGFVLGATLLACGGAADTQGSSESEVAATSAPISNFVQVRDGLYRGGHPDAAGLDYLRTLGVKTILDLEVGDFIEAMPQSISEEEDGAAARGFTLIRKPMSAFEPALSDRFDAQMDEILAILGDPSNGPVYVHCKHGQDRTGLVIGLERVFVEKWTPADAYEEMIARGFHKGFIGLKSYYERKTGFED